MQRSNKLIRAESHWIDEAPTPKSRAEVDFAKGSTMFDLYGLPTDFPDYEHAVNTHDPYDRVRILENALSRDISDSRLIPYFQLHEFEALLFCEPKILGSQFPGRGTEIRRLIETTSGFGSPELINDGSQTAPSKRIIKEIPEYEGRKASVGPIVANKIGLSILHPNASILESG